jgi:hypothetical protein
VHPTVCAIVSDERHRARQSATASAWVPFEREKPFSSVQVHRERGKGNIGQIDHFRDETIALARRFPSELQRHAASHEADQEVWEAAAFGLYQVHGTAQRLWNQGRS